MFDFRRLSISSLLCSVLIAAFSAGAAAAPDLSGMIVFPNPVRPDTNQNEVTFGELTEGAKIEIFTVRGQLVREINVGAQTSFPWDIKNNAGNSVASGIYIYLVTNGAGERRSGKLAVIR